MRESDDYLRRLALCRQALIANWGWTLPLSPKQDQLAQEWAVALGLARSGRQLSEMLEAAKVRFFDRSHDNLSGNSFSDEGRQH